MDEIRRAICEPCSADNWCENLSDCLQAAVCELPFRFMTSLPKKRGITQVEEDKYLILRQNTAVFQGNPIRLGNHLKGVKE